jgi:ribosomal protein RSM22 (predicted rRNA methylase)
MDLLRSSLVHPLAEDWRDTLDDLARHRGWPTSKDHARLAAQVAKLSTAYNAGDLGQLRSRDALSARLGFSFARDVPKAAGAVRELIATGALRVPEGRALRVLDLGAGLGASTWGLWAALSAYAPDSPGRIEAVCVDEDAPALSIAKAIAGARRGRGRMEVEVEALEAKVSRGVQVARGAFDVVLLGQVLSELGPATHVEIVRAALDRATPEGSVVLIEPALRDRTRNLHALRDALLAGGGVHVFAPCLHAAPCPALAAEGAWCHEDLDVDLPAWLAPVAAQAGLRWQGLTFSYLVLRKDERSLREHTAREGAALVRMVSEPIVTKGKREAFVCGIVRKDGELGPGRVRVRRLDREESETNAAWEEAARGDVLACEPPIDAGRPRIGPSAGIALVTPLSATERVVVDAGTPRT